MLLYKPDKNALEWKALAAACETRRMNPVELLAACGAIPSTHDYHYDALPRGGLSAGRGLSRPGARCRRCPSCRSPSYVRAFSIDDATTTEIDDAFSVRELPNGHYEVGIHIACPAPAMPRATPLDRIARERLSTVYMPGRKLTMLPDEAVDAFTLKAGTTPPALSLLLEVTPDGAPVRHETRVQRVPSPPTCASTRSAKRSPTTCRHPRIRRGPPSCACCGSSRSTCRRSAARTTSTASTTVFASTGTREPTDGWPSCRASAAARSTSSCPS